MLSRTVSGSDNEFDDVVVPRVLPDTSAVADPMSALYSLTSVCLLSCCGVIAGVCTTAMKLGAVDPQPVQDHGQPPGDRDLCAAYASSLGDLHAPSLEPIPFLDPGEQDGCSLAK